MLLSRALIFILFAFMCFCPVIQADYYAFIYYYNANWWNSDYQVSVLYSTTSVLMITCTNQGWYYIPVNATDQVTGIYFQVNSSSLEDNYNCQAGSLYPVSFNGEYIYIKTNSNNCGGNITTDSYPDLDYFDMACFPNSKRVYYEAPYWASSIVNITTPLGDFTMLKCGGNGSWNYAEVASISLNSWVIFHVGSVYDNYECTSGLNYVLTFDGKDVSIVGNNSPPCNDNVNANFVPTVSMVGGFCYPPPAFGPPSIPTTTTTTMVPTTTTLGLAPTTVDSSPTTVTGTAGKSTELSDSQLIPAIVVPVLVVIVILLALIIYRIREWKRKRFQRERWNSAPEYGERRSGSRREQNKDTEMRDDQTASTVSVNNRDTQTTLYNTTGEIVVHAYLQITYEFDICIEKNLAQGGAGELFVASLLEDKLLARNNGVRHAVVKTIKDASSLTEKENEILFLQEIAVMAALRCNKFVASIIGYAISPKCLILTQYAGDLFNYLHGEGGFKDMKGKMHPIEIKAKMIIQFAEAMTQIHSLGVIHRDLKTKNILLEFDAQQDNPSNPSYTIKVSDFGVCRVIQDQGIIKQKFINIFAMSTRYAAPEVFAKQGLPNVVIDPEEEKKIDIYSFAICVWEILTQQIPWGSIKNDEIRQKVCTGERPQISASDNVHEQMIELITSCWNQNPFFEKALFGNQGNAL